MSVHKILIDCYKLKHPNNGLDTFLRAYIAELEKIAHTYPFEISLLLPRKEVHNFQTSFPIIKQSIFKGSQLKKLSESFDLWHSTFHTLNKPSTTTCKHVATVHDLNPVHEKPHKKAGYLKLSHHHLKDTDHIVCISKFTETDVRAHQPELASIPSSVIYNGVTVTQEAKPPTNKPTKRFLFSLGAFMRKKNYECIVRMMPYVHEDIDLVIAGSSSGSYIDELQSIADHEGVANRVKLLPNISLNDKNWYLNHCAAFLFPSKLEGFGLPPAEAMKCGKTPFIFDATSVPEVVGEAGQYWQSEDPEHMAELVNTFLVNNHDTSHAVKNKCLKQSEKFSWNKMAQSYLDLFKELLD